MNISIIGSGNVATVLGKRIASTGHHIREVFSPTKKHAIELAESIGASPCSNWEEMDMSSDLYLAAISDQGLIQLCGYLNLDNKLIVHTAGSVSIHVLRSVSKNYGSFYPLQSLRKELNRIPDIPFLVDGNSNESLTLITDFAKGISDQVHRASDDQRLTLHLAAVIVNNFTNHLYSLTEKFCADNGVEFKLLSPLMSETTARLHDFSPSQTQTGPAARGDLETIAKHLQLLKTNPELRELYSVISKSIMQMKNGYPF